MASGEDHHTIAYPEDDDVLDDDDMDDDSEDDDDLLDDDENDEDDDTSSSNLAAAAASSQAVTIAVPGLPKPDPSTPIPHYTGFLPPSVDDAPVFTTPTAAAVEEKKPIAALDDSRKLFQRLWTDEDEIELLQGFLDYSTQRGVIGGANSSHHHHDTAAFYDQIKSKLQLEFNKNQLVEKLRRLKKKYRNALSKMESGKEFVFKSPHDQAAFEISKKIWSNDAVRGSGGFDVDDSNPSNPSPISVNLISFHNNNNGINNTGGGLEKKAARPRKRARGGGGGGVVKIEENSRLEFNTQPVRLSPPVAAASATPIPNLIEETVRSCLSPLFKELLQSVTNGNGLRGFGGAAMAAMSPVPLNLSSIGIGGGIGGIGIGGGIGGIGMGGTGGGGDVGTDERWRKQQIMELEVYSKRLELVQDQIKSALAELRSTTTGR